ncbi:MAG: PaaI family thioesterase [Azoarcus sp.]|nr:MAG: PaaI family thioesterase [Azoarcus sp.]TVT56572.1 MAG: PaaI family thioesterase [Azoarcus sp. PHD]
MSGYFGLNVPFIEYCGIKGLESGPGWTLSGVDIVPGLCNSMGNGHGGLIMTLLDVAMGSASRLTDPAAVGVITVDLHTTFIGPARGQLRCRADVLRKVGRTVFCEALIRDGNGEIVAKGVGTFKLRHGQAQPGSEG